MLYIVRIMRCTFQMYKACWKVSGWSLIRWKCVCVEAIWWLMLLKHRVSMTSVVNNIHARSMNYKPSDIFIL